jgi:1-acyl-sn-glycerol-3-phosphate acyltransferase
MSLPDPEIEAQLSGSPPLASLTPFERTAVRLVRRMNLGRWQRFWFWFQSRFSARWIEWITVRQLEVRGLEHVAATSRERSLLLVANHRTMFDLYVVMSVLFRRLPGWRAINFPVRGRYFYQTVTGVLLNFLAAWWAMWPPLFHAPRKRRFDQWALRELSRLCRDTPGLVVGYHPEGTRNRGPDPHTLLPAQPGVGRLIHEARPQVVPVFVAGLSNSFAALVAGNWRRGEPIRVRFGPVLEFDDLDRLPPSADTFRLIADRVMDAVGALAEEDRARPSSEEGSVLPIRSPADSRLADRPRRQA